MQHPGASRSFHLSLTTVICDQLSLASLSALHRPIHIALLTPPTPSLFLFAYLSYPSIHPLLKHFHEALFTSCSRILHPECGVQPRAPQRTLSSISSSLRHWAPSSLLSFFCPPRPFFFCCIFFIFFTERYTRQQREYHVLSRTLVFYLVWNVSLDSSPFTRSCLHIWIQKDPFKQAVLAERKKWRNSRGRGGSFL